MIAPPTGETFGPAEPTKRPRYRRQKTPAQKRKRKTFDLLGLVKVRGASRFCGLFAECNSRPPTKQPRLGDERRALLQTRQLVARGAGSEKKKKKREKVCKNSILGPIPLRRSRKRTEQQRAFARSVTVFFFGVFQWGAVRSVPFEAKLSCSKGDVRRAAWLAAQSCKQLCLNPNGRMRALSLANLGRKRKRKKEERKKKKKKPQGNPHLKKIHQSPGNYWKKTPISLNNTDFYFN